jgi:hypothetical protein
MKAKELSPEAVYALYDPKGEFIKTEYYVEDVVNHLDPSMPSALYHAIFNGTTKKQGKALQKAGYHIVRCRLVPLTKVRKYKT